VSLAFPTQLCADLEGLHFGRKHKGISSTRDSSEFQDSVCEPQLNQESSASRKSHESPIPPPFWLRSRQPRVYLGQMIALRNFIVVSRRFETFRSYLPSRPLSTAGGSRCRVRAESTCEFFPDHPPPLSLSLVGIASSFLHGNRYLRRSSGGTLPYRRHRSRSDLCNSVWI